ncbi:MAG: glycosyltransferase family 4 protein [Thermoleophilia bacterium]
MLSSWEKSLLLFREPLIKELVKNGHEVIACAPKNDETVTERLRLIGAGFMQVNIHRTGLNPFADLATYLSLKKTLRTLQPDILLSYQIKPIIYGSLAARSCGIKNIYSMITGLGYAFHCETKRQRLVNLVARRLYRISLKTNSSVFFQNPDDKKLFIDNGLVKDHQAILINGSGVDLTLFTPHETRSHPVSFILVARLLREKGVLEYAEAARLLRHEYDQICIRLLGPFDHNPSSIDKSLIRKWHESGLIEYLGETDDVKPALAAASVFVLPSYREGTPHSTLEALAMGLPVVTTDVPGCRETVVHGVNGFLVNSHDPISLANAMKIFIENPELIPKMGARSRKIAVDKFDVNQVNTAIMNGMGLIIPPTD